MHVKYKTTVHNNDILNVNVKHAYFQFWHVKYKITAQNSGYLEYWPHLYTNAIAEQNQEDDIIFPDRTNTPE